MGVQLPSAYLWLLVRRMTWDGEVRAVSYHRIGKEFGPLKRASFEQPLQTLLQAAQKGEVDACTGPTEACIFSRRFDPTDQDQQGEAERSLWGDLSTVPAAAASHSGVVGSSPRCEEYCPESPSYVPMSPSYRPTSPEPGGWGALGQLTE